MHRVFKCTLCGECCTKSPISILPHEEIILRSLAEKLGVEYRSSHGYRVFDRISHAYIALSYVMELVNGRCPFLREDLKCSIHDIYKPLICRSFPYVPKHVKYNIVWDLRIIYATTEYGLSLECPVIKRDKEYLENLLRSNKLELYIKQELDSAREMERIRSLFLTLLSELWRRGDVELTDDPGVKAPVTNLYTLLRKYYPSLPYILGVNKLLESV
ncbi:MAG: YkgJ family cysteine cluster protein [Thermoprotei archaeon]